VVLPPRAGNEFEDEIAVEEARIVAFFGVAREYGGEAVGFMAARQSSGPTRMLAVEETN